MNAFRLGDSTFKKKFIMIYIKVMWVWVACAQSTDNWQIDRVELILCRKSKNSWLPDKYMIWGVTWNEYMSQPDKEGLTDRANISNFRQLFFILRRVLCCMITDPFMLTETQVIQLDLNRKMCYAKNDCFKILHRLFFVKSQWVGACNSTTFLSRRFHRPIYF